MMFFSNRIQAVWIFVMIMAGMTACEKDDSGGLTDASFQDLEVNSGFRDHLIPVKGDGWKVEYVRLSDGTVLPDPDGNPMMLEGEGITEHAGGWITLKREESAEALSVSLRENFQNAPRIFLIGLSEGGKRDVVKITQNRGPGYKMVGQKFYEIEESLRYYTTDEDCRPVTLTNPGPVAEYQSVDGIFREVYFTSKFLSEDEGAFDWMENDSFLIFMPELIRDDIAVWSGAVPYRAETAESPFMEEAKSSQSLLVEPGTSIDVKGEITYAERSVEYVFTIENEGSGHRFDISGVCHQKIPLTPAVIIQKIY